MYHPQTKQILVSRDVVFVEDAVQPLLSCTKETGVSLGDVYDTLLPLFSGAQPPKFSLHRFQMRTQNSLFLMQMYMMHLLMRDKILRSHDQCQNGWCRPCMIAN